MNLSLIDKTALAFMQKFDRILDRQYVVVALIIDVINHGRQCG